MPPPGPSLRLFVTNVAEDDEVMSASVSRAASDGKVWTKEALEASWSSRNPRCVVGKEENDLLFARNDPQLLDGPSVTFSYGENPSLRLHLRKAYFEKDRRSEDEVGNGDSLSNLSGAEPT